MRELSFRVCVMYGCECGDAVSHLALDVLVDVSFGLAMEVPETRVWLTAQLSSCSEVATRAEPSERGALLGPGRIRSVH